MLLMAVCRTGVFNLSKLKSVGFSAWREVHESSNTFSAEKLRKRSIVNISGDTSSEFLQGLITNDIRVLEQGASSIFTLFLNNRGRILFDVIIYPGKQKDSFLLECDAEVSGQLIKHLTIYKVRRKIDISSNSELCVWAIYSSKLIDDCLKLDKGIESISNEFDDKMFPSDKMFLVPDPRLPVLGYRALVDNSDEISNIPQNNLYRMCRYKLGVAEGVDEFEVGKNFPLEVNGDFLNGISFDKGCYIGQELTARTFHTGVVRKRLMPLIFNSEPSGVPPNTIIDDPVESKRTPTGKVRAYCGKYGIGLMRVSEALKSNTLKMLDISTQLFIPFWWPSEYIDKNYARSKNP